MRIELRDIHKHFGAVRANDGISLTFEPGRIYGLLGENGAGKSTLMKILSGYQPPTSGQILLDDTPMSFSDPLAALSVGIGMLYQDPLDFPPMQTVENHLLAYDDRLILDLKRGEDELLKYAARFGFEIEPGTYVDSLTLGERQQMELLRLLALGAEVLILDEPTTGISQEQKEILFSTMRRLVQEEDKTIILVSHKLEEVQELCNEAAVLRRGKLVGMQDIPCETSDLVRLMFGEDLPSASHESYAGETSALSIRSLDVMTYRLSISDIDLEVAEGEVLGLAGLEGSGQRLLMRACAGLEPVAGGSVQLAGSPVAALRSPLWWLPRAVLPFGLLWALSPLLMGGYGSALAVFSQFGQGAMLALVIWLVGTILVSATERASYHVFQAMGGAYVPAGRLEEGLIAGLTLTEHMVLATPNTPFNIDWETARAAIAERITRTNVIGRPDSRAEELSGGNMQRLLIGLLDDDLKVIMLEHPTRGLDVTSANHIWAHFTERRQQGAAIVFMSADLDELRERSDQIAVFSGGKLIKVVSARDVTVEELGTLIGGQQV